MTEALHLANIALHVAAAALALLLAAWILAMPKGDRAHVRMGKTYAGLMLVVIGTAAIGAILFRAAPTLIAVTCLVAYQLFSGVRAARAPAPQQIDTIMALAALVLGACFAVYLLTGAPAFWSPPVTIPIAATLVAVSAYDLARLAAPRWRERVRRLEHGVKMIMTVGGLASAGLGTVLTDWRPWSQILPASGMLVFAVVYVLLRRSGVPAASSK